MALIVPSGQPRPIQSGDFKGASAPNVITFALDKVAPPSELYIQRDDTLIVVAQTVLATDTVAITGRFLRASDGIVIPFRFDLIVTPGLNAAVKAIPLGEGYLLGMSASSGATLLRGQTFVRASIVHSTNPGSSGQPSVQQLFAGYAVNGTAVSWPGGMNINSQDGPGAQTRIVIANPAAGAEFNSGLLQGAMLYRLVYMRATLTTSAVVAARQIQWRINEAASFHVSMGASTTVPASSTVTVMAAPNYAAYADAQGNIYMPAPGALFNSDVFNRILSNTINLQAGDAWTSIMAYLELYPQI